MKTTTRTAAFAAATLLLSLPAFAGQLDVAVIRFSDQRDPGALAAALAGVDLAELSNAGRTRTKDPVLFGGSVLFSQSIPANPGTTFNATTRIGNARADVAGSLAGGRAQVEITVSEGVQGSVTGFEKRTFQGNAPLPAGPATILSIRQSKVKAPYVVRNQATVETSNPTTVVVAQYKP